MRTGIVLDQEEPRVHSTSIRSLVHYTDMDVCANLQGYSSADHHWPTAKPVMLDDAADSITFPTASADSFTSATCAHCEPCSHLWRYLTCRFWCSLANASWAAWCKAVSTSLTLGCQALMESVSDTSRPVVYWRSFSKALAVFFLFLLTQRSGCRCPSTTPSSSLHVMANLLYALENVLLVHMDVPSWRNWTTWESNCLLSPSGKSIHVWWVVLLLHLQCTCHYHLHQSGWNWYTIPYAS